MRLRSSVAVAVAQAGSYSSDWTPSLGTSICHGCSPTKKKKFEVFHLFIVIIPKGADFRVSGFMSGIRYLDCLCSVAGCAVSYLFVCVLVAGVSFCGIFTRRGGLRYVYGCLSQNIR